MTGFLDQYWGQETEGHKMPVMFPEHKGKINSDLEQMQALIEDSIIVVFKNKRSNKTLYYGKVKDCPNIDALCEQHLPAILLNPIERQP